uniref:ATP citrate lyase citrate-binding domain-containing protein n=1 Tax=Geoalkalibacter sp. TaxID=3041440 RepID=UPI00272E7D6B
AGLVRIVKNPFEAMVAKRDLYFAVHEQGNRQVQANGVTFEGFIPSDIEIYVNISASTLYRSPVLTLTTEGGVEVEDIPESRKRVISFNPATGLKAFHVHDALRELECPAQYISPLVQHLPKLWQLYDNYGMTVLELNPIRMTRRNDRYLPVACDIKAAFDVDNPAWRRLGFPEEIFSTELSRFEAEINVLRTHQGQSDVVEINAQGSILPFMFGGGANSVTTEILGDRAILSSDFGGNPPYEKMKAIADITMRHWLRQSRVLLIIGGRANNTDIFTTFKGMFDALRDNIHLNPRIHVVVGRGGPRLVEGLTYARDIMERLQIPYAFFGFDSSMVSVIHYALELDRWLEKVANKAPAQTLSESAFA